MKRFIIPISTVWLASVLLVLIAARSSAQTAAAFGNLPLSFEAGQAGQFVAHGRDSQFTISATGAQLALRPTATEPAHTVGLQFVGTGAANGIEGLDELPGKVNYLVGNNPEQWRMSVPTFARVQLADIYPGINVVYYGNQRQVEYDFNLAAGVNPDVVAVRFSGADKISLDAQGGLVLAVGRQIIRQPKPLIYQTVNHERREIAGGYRIVNEHTVAFTVGAHDSSLPLVIDPVLSYSSYFGGNSGDAAWAVAVDTNGFVYVAGSTFSTQKRTVRPLFQRLVRFKPILPVVRLLVMRLWRSLVPPAPTWFI